MNLNTISLPWKVNPLPLLVLNKTLLVANSKNLNDKKRKERMHMIK
jgi:hypothetical protein